MIKHENVEEVKELNCEVKLYECIGFVAIGLIRNMRREPNIKL